MKTIALLTAALLVASPAFADLINQNQNGGVGNTQNAGGYINSPGAGSPSATSVGVANSHASSKSYNTNVANQGQDQHQGQFQGQSADNKGNKLSVEQNYAAQKRNPVSTAFAAPLVAADDTCMGSSSVGGQGVGFGLSVGSTWHDNDCVRRKDARELHNMGQHGAALALLCQSDNVAEAMVTAGTPCPGKAVSSLAPAAGTPERVRSNPQTNNVTTIYPTSVRAIDRM